MKLKTIKMHAYIVLCLFVCSCTAPKKEPIKPYVIIDKECDYLTTEYTLIDVNGYQFDITERDYNKHVGDTIK